MPSRRTKRFPVQRGRGIQLPASTRHAERVRANASILPACLRRIQAVERNVAKQRANGAVHWPLRRGVKCSRLQTDGVRQIPGGSLRVLVHGPSGSPASQGVSHTCHPRSVAGALASCTRPRSLPPVRALCGGCFGSTCRVINLSAKRGRRASRTGRNAVLAQRCLCLSRD